MEASERDDQLLVRYLLGELPDGEASELEQAVLTDGGRFEQLRAIEDDLVDAYVRGELSSRQARSFESRFLATGEGRSRVAMARGLLAAVDRRPAPVASGETLWQRFGRLLAPPVRTPRLAWVAVLVLAVGLAWIGRDLLPRDPVARDPIGGDPIGTAVVATETVSLLLSSGVRGSGGAPRVDLGPEVGAVELQVDLEGDENHRGFRARLESAAGEELQSWPQLVPRDAGWGPALSFELPADLLPPGRYLVTVEVLGADSVTDGYLEYGRYPLEIVSVTP